MKLIRTLFQTTLLLAVILVVFSHPLRADSGDATPTQLPFVQPAPDIKSKPSHHSVSRILAEIESDFMGDVVPLAGLFLLGRGIWLMIPRPPAEMKVVEEQPPVEVPPLRPIPQRITIF